MTIKQKIMKAAYPIVMWLSSFKNKEAKIKINSLMVLPAEPIYNFSTDLIDDNKFSFSDLKGKKILLVNTASDCGFTNQYEDLEKLYKKYNGRLVILGFPSNDFQQQESGSNQAIANFCKLFFGVSFPLMKKTGVIKNNEQNDVFNFEIAHTDERADPRGRLFRAHFHSTKIIWNSLTTRPRTRSLWGERDA